MRPFAWCTQQSVHMTVHMRSELIWPASLAIILQSRHDLEVRSLISRMRRLSACAQGAKRSDSKASMSALGWLHQEGGAWQCGAVSRSASGSKHVQGRSASESAHAESTLDRRARVEHHSASRGGIACHAGRGEGSASGGSFLCVCRALLRCACASARLVASSVTRCVVIVHTLSLICSPVAAVTKILAHAC